MKQKTNRMIVWTLVLLSITLITLNSSAQNRNKQFVADTGVITLKPNHTLRLMVTPGSDDQTYRIRFRRCQYTENGGVFVVSSSPIGPIILLPPNEARSFDTTGQGSGPSVRVRVASNNSNFVATFHVIDTDTGEIIWEVNGVVTEQDVWASAP